MKVLDVQKAQKAHPTGDPNFAVMQPFPAGMPAEDTDPFLMCDQFGPKKSEGIVTAPDEFPMGWHPHRGIDVLTYMKQGVGRHANSLGNRGVFQSPGMEWISVGSGIEHAGGGGTPAGESESGFQIWVNVPKKHKMDDPKCGIEVPESIPIISVEGVKGLILAGTVGDKVGPFQTVQPIQMVDYELTSNQTFDHFVPPEMNNCIIYVYKGEGIVSGKKASAFYALRLDCTDPINRTATLKSGPEGMSVMVFAGKRINEPIAWHGPFVMNTDEEINRTIKEYRQGTLLKKRTAWDYKKISTKPVEAVEIVGDQSLCGYK